MKASELRIGAVYEMKGGDWRRITNLVMEPNPPWQGGERLQAEWEYVKPPARPRPYRSMKASSFAYAALREITEEIPS